MQGNCTQEQMQLYIACTAYADADADDPNANTGANTASEIDKRGRKTKLRYVDSGTKANAIHMPWQHLKLINAVAKKNMCDMDLEN